MKFKIGDKVRVAKTLTNHDFKEDFRWGVYEIEEAQEREDCFDEYKLKGIGKTIWFDDELELMEERKMDIKEVCREDNIGKSFKDSNGWEWEVVECFDDSIDLRNGLSEFIATKYRLDALLKLRFEETLQYKKITGKEALKIMLDGGFVWDTKQFSNAYYIAENKLFYYSMLSIRSILGLEGVLDASWYIKQ